MGTDTIDGARTDASLGGALAEVSVLFADLQGFTAFSEGVEPDEVATMLNRYLTVAVPCVLAQGGTVVQFVGDALLAVWRAREKPPDHAARAVAAAVAMQAAAADLAAANPGWPRFRVGVNSGPAWVGTIGSELVREFNVMGDAVNVAARLQQVAEPGQVVVGEATRCAVGDAHPVSLAPLGDLPVKGRRAPVRAYAVTVGQVQGLRGAAAPVPAQRLGPVGAREHWTLSTVDPLDLP